MQPRATGRRGTSSETNVEDPGKTGTMRAETDAGFSGQKLTNLQISREKRLVNAMAPERRHPPFSWQALPSNNFLSVRSSVFQDPGGK
jgi:hypothetical protein